MNEMKQKGLLTEIHCQLAFTELGFLVMIPQSEDSRYDFVVDVQGKFLRIQCKTASISQDGSCISFSCRSTRSTTQENISRKYSKDEIDYFYTYYWGKSYLIPVEECSGEKTLRFIPPKSGQLAKINFAEDYELKTILRNRENIQSFQEIISTIPPLKEDINSSNYKTSICSSCGEAKTPEAKFCINCTNKNQQTVERPSREELKNLIRTMPMVQVGKLYGVTDNAIRKWCKAVNLPFKVSEIHKYSDTEWEKL